MATFLPGSYITIKEYRAAPTALSTNNLVPGGTQQDQDNELAGIIKRASRFIDNTARQNLYVTRATQNEQVRTDPQGYFVLRANQDRVKSVDAFAWGASPTGLSALVPPILPSQYFIEEHRVLFSRAGGSGASWVGGLGFLATPRGRPFVSWTYTAGWVTTRLAASAAIAAQTVTVEDPLGIRAGDVLRVVDGSNQTTVQVAATYVPGSVTVPLVEPLVEPWPAGSGVFEAPDDITEAAMLATTHYIKSRKSGGFVMGGASATVDTTTDAQLGHELEQARQLALRYQRRAT